MTLRVAELFGPTTQGEGPHIGHVSAFLRLSGCNLSCAWCDTPYTWDETRFDLAAESVAMEPAEIIGTLRRMPHIERVVLTGGEPLVQQKKLPELLRQIPLPVDVETNGTIMPTDELVELIDTFVVSPKIIPSAEQVLSSAHKPPAFERFRQLGKEGRAVFKYVARDNDDLKAIEYQTFGLDCPVYVMPEGRTAHEVVANTQAIADFVVAHGWRLTTRLHVLAWGDERGR